MLTPTKKAAFATGAPVLAVQSPSDLSTDWMDDAACRGTDPDLFFPDGDNKSVTIQAKTAKLICRGCPVSLTCLAWSIDSVQEFGIWGGRTDAERRQLKLRSGRG
jgi:WhiB family transcriptional regulator, redox-sensing transcriptional regulator